MYNTSFGENRYALDKILVKMVDRPPLFIMQLFKIILKNLAKGLMFSDGQCSMESLG